MDTATDLTSYRADEARPSSQSLRHCVAEIIRARRAECRLTLQQIAERVGCAKSYLSQIENGQRPRPPSEALLRSLEEALFLPAGVLIEAARWETTPPSVRREVVKLQSRHRAMEQLARIVGASGVDDGGRITGRLDEAYRSGELHKLVEAVSPASDSPVRIDLPHDVPLINKVSAGYPKEFTDLGYPARVADEYVRCPDLRDPDAFAARVVGDSMWPDYHEGDIIIFSPSRTVRSGMDCFARLEPDHETTFKRIYFETATGGEELIRLQPLNSAYPPRTLPREQVAGLYAAVSVMRSL